MVALLVTLLFTTAFAASMWSIWATIQPRLPYIRALLTGELTPPLVTAPAPRIRTTRRPASSATRATRTVSAAA